MGAIICSAVKINATTGSGSEIIHKETDKNAHNETDQNAHTEQQQRKKSKEENINSKIKHKNLFLKVFGCNHTDTNLKARLKRITNEDLIVEDIRHDGKDTFFTVHLRSSKLTKKIIFFIYKENKENENTENEIFIIDKQQEDLKEQPNFFQDKQNKLKELMDKEACDVVSNHNKMINEVQQRIKNVAKNLVMDSHEYNEEGELDIVPKIENLHTNFTVESTLSHGTKQEIDALQDKLSELRLQQKEFKDFITCMDEMFQKHKSSKNSAMKVYSKFQIECKHLKSALPMYARRNEIVSTVTTNQVSIIIGETGSGKSTQVTQYLYQAGLADSGLIVCTQPRKIAATSLATRVAHELNTSVGNLVGYHVGMQMKTSKTTKIIYMTDQMLLNLCLKDETFSKYSCIIIDEAHERSIYTDLLLGMIKTSLTKRPELKVVITSATIEPEIFVNFFGTCPVLKIAGRMFPVDVIWPTENEAEEDYKSAALKKTVYVHEKEQSGDILTFLTSPLEIEKCCNNFEKTFKDTNNFICLPLHGRLQPQEQQKVFEPSPVGKRKIVFATNSAETSITIPGIKYVIDTGVAKEMLYDPQKNINALNVTNITRSSAEQRKGRAGRTEPGKCYRLYTENTYNNMETNSKPEISRVHLGQALLKLYELGVNPLQFDFVQKPSQHLIDTAMETLELVGAVSQNKITERGKWIAKLPIDPKFGAFVYEAIKEGIGIEGIVLSACCGTSSMFYRSGSESQKNEADKRKVRFCHEGGDFMTMLEVFREWHSKPEKSKSNWCSQNSINNKVLRGIRETVNEILNVLKKEQGILMPFQLKTPKDVDEKLQEMLFKIFRQNLCHYLGHDKAGYLVVQKDQIVQIFPASSLKTLGLQPDWIVIERVLKTSRDFAINITPVKDSWLQKALADDLLNFDLNAVQSQRVEQAAFCAVGEKLLSNFVGVRYSELRNLEKTMRQVLDGTFVTIEASKEYGEITAFATEKNKETVKAMINDRLSLFKGTIKGEIKEFYLSPLKKGVKVVVGAGMDIVDVLMPNEYKTVVVNATDNSISEKDICEYFEKFGNVVNAYKFTNSKDRTKWGKITFKRREDAESSVQSTKDKSINAIPDIGYQPVNAIVSLYTIRAKIEWCRRPTFAFIKFNDSSLVQRACKTPISIGEMSVRITKGKVNASEVHVANLCNCTTEDELRTAFINALSLESGAIENITIRKKNVKTNECELQTLKEKIESKLNEYVIEGTYYLDLKIPRDNHVTFLAFVSFSSPEEGMAAYAGIHKRFKINYQTVSMSVEFKTSVAVRKHLFPMYEETLSKLSKTLDKNFNVKHLTKTLKNGNVLVELLCENSENIMKAKTVVEKVIDGKKYVTDQPGELGKLFNPGGKRFFERVKNETNTIIHFDARDFSIIIHGTTESQEKAAEMITMCLRDLRIGVSQQMALKGPDKPVGVMRELMMRYGYDLNLLVDEYGLKNVELDRRRHILTVTGEQKAVQIVIEKMQMVIEETGLKMKGRVLKSSKTRECVVCFCEIEDGNMYRLEVCGHSYCKQCVQFQFQADLNSLPVCCSSEACDEKWALKDITIIADKTNNPVDLLVEKATSSFVAKNSIAYKYCTTPDCPMIYRVSEKENLFTCPQCESRICTGCNKQYHDGLTCEQVKKVASTKEADDNLHLFLQECELNIKKCPKCSTLIEKIDGCNHVTCQACRTNICWVCLDHYPTDVECYVHLSQEHGGCFNF
ncbi:uncharacterized protein LOC134688289 [Mytilus trossulus]|uniref:uncharacterized protein LOC134688289 n=1 Tax=Mytilus trossulus TaxID=6551 RepID=UPI0030062248